MCLLKELQRRYIQDNPGCSKAEVDRVVNFINDNRFYIKAEVVDFEATCACQIELIDNGYDIPDSSVVELLASEYVALSGIDEGISNAKRYVWQQVLQTYEDEGDLIRRKK